MGCTLVEEMDHDEMGCQAAHEAPILCFNNCGFFGRAETMNMCSKCYKDHVRKLEQEKLAASSFDNIVNGGGSSSGVKDPVVTSKVDFIVESVELKTISVQPLDASLPSEVGEIKPKEGPSKCNACRKHVGLTGFSCKCGNVFCVMHCYSDKHDCPFDYRTAG